MRWWLMVGVWLAVVGTVMAQQAEPAAGGKAMLSLARSTFPAGGEVPKQCSCKGGDASPGLEWKGGPAEAISYALIMDDPDAPGGLWTHWVLWNVPASAHSL